MASVRSAATWWCGACRQTGQGDPFRRRHEECDGMLEERLFTSVTGAPPPTELEDVLAELEAAKNSDLLRAPDIAFVQQMLAPLHEIDFRHMTEEEEIRVPTHDGVESMFRMRKSKTYHDGGAALMTELEAAIVAHCTEFSVSAAARQDLCNMLANRDVIRHGLPGRMDMRAHRGWCRGSNRCALT